jgi:uncharacterized protein (DUF305 family)
MHRPRRFWVAFGALAAACVVAGGVALGVTVTRESGSPAGHAHGTGLAALGPRDFIELMIPHHQMAIRMAQTAMRRADGDLAVVEVSRDIIAQQRFEIGLMRRWYRQWYGEPVPNRALTADETAAMGMATDMSALARARPVAPAFFDAMIPHHAGAIVMVQRLLLGHPPAVLARLARSMEAGQAIEIGKMERYRQRGQARAASPAPSTTTAAPVVP